jgi:hypothetical protein
MAGLNTDPLTDASYGSIDYAIHVPNSGIVYVYESGTGYTFGSYTAGDVFTVVYDGLFVRYLQNGNVLRTVPALPGLKLYFDSSIVAGGLKNIQFQPYTNAHQSGRGINLIDASWWKQGLTPTATWASAIDSGGTDAFVTGTLPDGSSGIVWQATSGSTSGSSGGGGWNPNTNVTNSFTVNPNKAYMFAVYTKSISGSTGTEYWGIQSSTTCDLNTSTTNTNAYFATQTKVTGVWHLLVGWVYPAGTTGNSSSAAGAYRCSDGVLVNAGTNYNWVAGIQTSSTRSFQYYQNAGSVQQFAWPMVFLCDGSEPSIDELLSMGSTNGRNPINSTNASTYISSAAIGLAQINTASIGSLSAITATIGTLRTASSGGRAEIYDNVIKVYDASNVLRVKIGNLSL